MTASQQTTQGQAHLMVFAQQHPADSLDQGQQPGAAKGLRQALLQVDRSSEQTPSKPQSTPWARQDAVAQQAKA